MRPQKCSKYNTKKIPHSARQQTRSVPLNAASNRQELSEQCSIFALGESEHAARIDGIDCAFLFGNARQPSSHRGCTPFPSRLGPTQVSQGLALVGTNCSNMHLRFDTVLVSSGPSWATLTPGGGGRGGIPLLRVLQVSNCLDIL